MSKLYQNQISKNHSPSREYIINRDIFAVRVVSLPMKRLVTMSSNVDAHNFPLLLKQLSVKMLITYSTELRAHYLYGGVPTLN